MSASLRPLLGFLTVFAVGRQFADGTALRSSADSLVIEELVKGTPHHPGLMRSELILQALRHQREGKGASLLQLELGDGYENMELTYPELELAALTKPWKQAGTKPLTSCEAVETSSSSLLQRRMRMDRSDHTAKVTKESSDADSNLRLAASHFCSIGLGHLVEFYVDPKFAQQDAQLRDQDGWLPEAFVVYMGLREPKDKIGSEVDLLLQSVHHFSDRPIVVTNFGGLVPTNWTPERFPRMILMHSRSTSSQAVQKSFNFNKLTGMMFTKVKTGIALDADQWVNRGLDSFFDRVAKETTADHPYPVMPVHWMSRDPESSDMKGYPDGYAFHFASNDAPKRTMRWGHAHPTWTHHALPFLAKWTGYALRPEIAGAPQWFKDQGPVEDEDVLNVGLWAEGVSKQWCKFDITSPSDFEGMYMVQKMERPLFQDSKYYPKGIAYIFYTAHDAKDPKVSYNLLQELWEPSERRQAINYDGKWFDSAEALKAYDPDLKCIA